MVAAASSSSSWLAAHLAAVVWACVAGLAAGVVGNALMARESWLDWRWVKASTRHPAKRLLAWDYVRADLALLSFNAVACLVRLWSATGWPDPGDPAFAARWAADVVVFTAAQLAFLTYPAFVRMRERRRIEDLVRPGKTAAADRA